MKPTQDEHTFSLENFEGPLPFLLQLVQKSEIPISDIPVASLVDQYISFLEKPEAQNLDSGGDFVNMTALLLWLKSKKLLPSQTDDEQWTEEELSPLALIPQLLEYQQFKALAELLSNQEHSQHYFRGNDPSYTPSQKLQGIEKVSLQKLGELFTDVLEKSARIKKDIIQEEQWRTEDKMTYLRNRLSHGEPFRFEEIFSPKLPRVELIVTFLALLEMIKNEELCVMHRENHYYIEKVSHDIN